MLHSMAATLASLDDVDEIGEAITEELRTILDYHNCRVYVLQDDGSTLMPIAFRGEIFYEYEHETLEELITHVGEGITGWVAEHRTSVAHARREARCEFAVQIPDTDDILESMLAVPMTVGDDGPGRHRPVQPRLRRLRRGGPAAPRGARLPRGDRDLERQAAPGRARGRGDVGRAPAACRSSSPQLRSVGDILQGAIETVSSLIGAAAVGRSTSATSTRATSGSHGCSRSMPDAIRPRPEIGDVPESVAVSIVFDNDEPLVVRARSPLASDPDYRVSTEPREVLVAPLRWEPDGAGTIAVVGRDGDGVVRRARPPADPRRRRPHVARARQRTTDVRARTVP